MKRALPHVIVCLLGVWLMAAPAVLGYVGTAAETSDRLVGPTIAAIGFVAASEITRSVRWANLVAAAWLVAGPWLIGAPTAAAINSLVVGLLVGALSPLGKPDTDRFGGGWSSLWKPERLAPRRR